MTTVDLGTELGTPVGESPDVLYPSGHPRVERRPARQERPRAEPRLERVPVSPRRGCSKALREDVVAMFARLGVVERTGRAR